MKGYVKLVVIVTVAIAMTLSGCKFSKHEGQKFDGTQEISAIETYSNIELNYTPSGSTHYSVEANAETTDKLVMEIQDGVLTVKANGLQGTDTIVVNISAPKVASFTSWNNSTINVIGSVKTGQLGVNAYNNARICFNQPIEADKIELTAWNNATIDIQGGAKHIHITTLNSPTINAQYLQAKDGFIEAIGNATLIVNIENLESSLKGDVNIANLNQ